MAIEREKIYECEVKRRRVKVGGGYEPFWKIKAIAEALVDNDSSFRCKDCFGAVKLFNNHRTAGSQPHVEHKLRSDSEYCVAGIHYRNATDGRQSRPSEHPVR